MKEFFFLGCKEVFQAEGREEVIPLSVLFRSGFSFIPSTLFCFPDEMPTRAFISI